MKKLTLCLSVFAVITVVTFTSMSNTGGCDPSLFHAAGAPAGVSGDPAGGNINCTSCHAGPAAATQSGWIISNIPGTGYVPLTTYTITATATRANHTKFGFEVSPQNPGGTLLGTLINTSTQTQLTGTGNKYITHTSTGTTGTTGFHTWTFNWTAPAAGAGAVTFYGAFNITNADNANTLDTIKLSTLTVQEHIPLSVAITGTNISCNGLCNGKAAATASGGITPYSYLWDNGQTTTSITGLCAGTYTVTAIDGSAAAATNTVSISEPPLLSISPSQTTISCNGRANGKATATVSGGTAPYSYSWSNGQSTSAATNLSATNYSVTVTDAHSCTNTATFTITQPTVLTATITSQSNVSCNGGSNGSATVTAGGGSPAYKYFWNNSQTSSTATNLSAGNYTVTVTDANLCTQTASVTITQPAAMSITVTTTNASCGNPDGSATASASGTVAPYTYSWNNGQTDAIATGLSAGNYTVTVTDGNTCTKAAAAAITNSGNLSVTASSSSVTCHGGNDGTATANQSGGNPSYTFSWNTSPVQTTQTATGLSAGTYNIKVTDASTCISTSSVFVSQPAAINISPSVTNPSCNGICDAIATANVSGGTPAYSYFWNTGNTTITCSALCAGDYTVAIMDINTCTAVTTFNISQPGILTSSMSVTDASSCGTNDGDATATISGGTFPYSYSWNNGASTSANAGLAQGTYSLLVTDANGCTLTNTATVSCPNNVDPISLQNNFTIYPNPGKGIFMIATKEKEYELIITNVLGETILSERIYYENPEIDLNDQSKGIYFVHIKTEHGIINKKLLIN